MKQIIIIALLSLVACNQSSISDDPFKGLFQHEEPTKQSAPSNETEDFSASISVADQLKSHEEFIVEATLKNLTNNGFTIQHAAKVFYVTIKDSNGKVVNTFVMPEVGIVRNFQANQVITEQYACKLEKPGRYEVSATARFAIVEGDNRDYEVTTNKATIDVVL
ncbi:hypothetical protein [Paenibacillus xerothermodurans]|uniref:Intracellular proteinase inhibitor BsuPI domain-containing protein n=1 Tax=Paenibacillus xerothermodurans TaxID=1977292 RepID=A0A2W1NZM1_PAEXE|nr:hypothetical protein [Paenibacillus xerothermodurans]PZE20318.1 hypothetical protein CBW46_014325 [Paenibacillus xerothermodurans]